MLADPPTPPPVPIDTLRSMGGPGDTKRLWTMAPFSGGGGSAALRKALAATGPGPAASRRSVRGWRDGDIPKGGGGAYYDTWTAQYKSEEQQLGSTMQFKFKIIAIIENFN